MNAPRTENRLIVISNRLPFVLTQTDGGEWKLEPGSGGLVSALLPVLRNRGGMWIGWHGLVKEATDEAALETALSHATRDAGYTLMPVLLTAEEKQKFYYGFSNEVIWPLFHDLQTRCNFDPSYWGTYQVVNRKFASVAAQQASPGDLIWVHDYHLMGLAKELRELGVTSPLAFFLHTPFPSLDIFLKLPWRFHVLRGLLEYDLIGFQTQRDRRNFIYCIRKLIDGTSIEGKGQVVQCLTGHRVVRLGAFPIGIDYEAFARRAASKEVEEQVKRLREDLSQRHLILGVDRLDYTKGILERMEAFRNALTRYPELVEKIVFVQIVVPSREDIPQYHDLKTKIERLVGEINGQFTKPGWVPIHYLFRSVSRTELIAFYRTADIALVTPLKDGMNLVAKEFCAGNHDKDGVLILSEFAGAAAQLQDGALLMNPYHIEGVADVIYQAFKMDMEERRVRMKKLRRAVREADVFWWVDSFLNAAIEKELEDFPVVEEYIPPTDDLFPLTEVR